LKNHPDRAKEQWLTISHDDRLREEFFAFVDEVKEKTVNIKNVHVLKEGIEVGSLGRGTKIRVTEKTKAVLAKKAKSDTAADVNGGFNIPLSEIDAVADDDSRLAIVRANVNAKNILHETLWVGHAAAARWLKRLKAVEAKKS
jgi:hypothetical protein